MARIRTIKPDFWTDEKLSECSLSARLVFIGLWTFADDDGRMEYQPARIRMQLFPCGAVSPARLIEYLGELSERSLIRIYTVDGKQFLDIPNFAKHQKINRPTPSRLPPFSGSAHGILSERSPLEGKGTGRERIRAAQQPRATLDGFAELRIAYPRRAGSHRWADAEKAYRKRLSEGHTPEVILAGVKRYAALCTHEGMIGQRTVMQAATFLGDNLAFLEPYSITPKPQPQQRFNGAPPPDPDAADLAFAKTLGYAPKPGESSAEFLARFRPWNQQRIAKLEGRAA